MYLKEKLKLLLHGCDYNLDQWINHPEILKQDILFMKDAGCCNGMSVGIFSWAKVEPVEGVFDFKWHASIIILNEATANVDPENENELTETIRNLTRQKNHHYDRLPPQNGAQRQSDHRGGQGQDRSKANAEHLTSLQYKIKRPPSDSRKSHSGLKREKSGFRSQSRNL